MTDEYQLTEEKIFRAATEIFEEKGMTGTRMQDIADRAGINKALLHYYFRSKEKLFAAVFDKLAEKMFTRFAGILEKEMPLDEKIEYFFKEHISFLRKNPKLPLFLLGEADRDPGLLKKYLGNIDFKKIRRATKSSGMGKVSDMYFAQMMITIISMSIFPIVARPIFEKILTGQGIDYEDFLDQRIKFSSQVIMNSFGDSQTHIKLKNN